MTRFCFSHGLDRLWYGGDEDRICETKLYAGLVPAAFTKEAQYTCSKPGSGFVIENRDAMGERQNTAALGSYFEKSSPDEFVQTLSDFHLLIFLAKMESFQSDPAMFDTLLEAVKEKDNQKVLEWSHNPAWMQLQQEMLHQPTASPGMDLDPELREAIARSLRET